MQFFTDCDCTTLLIASSVFITLVFFIKSRQRPRNFPPGPRGIPLLGYIPFVGDNGAEKIMKMKKKYGPVMSIQLGMEDWIVLNDFKFMNEALVKQGEKFSGRPRNFIFDLITEGYGIASADYGDVWRNLRKFGLMTLRGFGVGKKGMEENVIEEMPFLTERLTTDDEDSVGTKMSLAVSNIICRVVFGSRFDYDDKTFRFMIKLLRDFASGENKDAKYIGPMFAAPQLRYVPPFKGALQGLMKEIQAFLDVFRKCIEEHRKTFDENDIRDFIDAFLLEMKKKGENDPIFCDGQLLQYICDLFEAGAGTTSSTLSWMILIFANLPECQEKIFQEIESVIGESGNPSMKHRDDMPYTCAFIQEVLRYKTLVPLGIFHKTNEDAVLNGYNIPKDTSIIPNFWAVHFDPKLFPNPNVFRPERFIKDGKFVKSSHVIPFSIGPRHCLGEQLAVMELFIFLVGIVQSLKVVPDPSNPPPALESGTYIFFSTYEAPEFKIKFEKR